jgi:Dinucleotide-utilizing enzymes involved in molybdopterin and thiamine biosynthesis family 2
MDDKQLLRYSRHILLPQVDIKGQEAISAGRVLIIGIGGLGSPVSMYLAASGVGTLVLVDDDKVDVSNLQRQIVHREYTLGLSKVESAAQTLAAINSTVCIKTLARRLDEIALMEQVEKADVVVDCSDNFVTRKLLNRTCLATRTPLVSGAAIRLEGQLAVFDFRDQTCPCYQCLYALTGDEDLTCSQNGVLSPVVGVVGSHQALEALKILGSFGKLNAGRLALFDGYANQWRYLNAQKDPKCEVCGNP